MNIHEKFLIILTRLLRCHINVSNYIFHQRNKNSFKFGNEIYIMKYLKSSSIQIEFHKIFFFVNQLSMEEIIRWERGGTFQLVIITLCWLMQKFVYIFRSSHQRCSVRKGAFRNFAKSTGKDLCQGLFFNKVTATLLKKRPWHRYCEILRNF